MVYFKIEVSNMSPKTESNYNSVVFTSETFKGAVDKVNSIYKTLFSDIDSNELMIYAFSYYGNPDIKGTHGYTDDFVAQGFRFNNLEDLNKVVA